MASYGIADELGFEVGLSCGGSIDVLIEPFVPDVEWDALRRCVERQQPVVYAVGLAPAPLLGRKLTRPMEGQLVGSISPSLDSHVVEEGDRLLQTGGTNVVNLPWEGEQAQVFVEVFRPSPSLLIVGATHTAISLCRLAAEVGFEVTVIDVRSALATPERFSEAKRIIHAWPEEALTQVSLDSYSSLVVLTHDPKFDVPALACALGSQVRYIGAQGSRVTHEGRKRELQATGLQRCRLGAHPVSHRAGFRVSHPCRDGRIHLGRSLGRPVRQGLRQLGGRMRVAVGRLLELFLAGEAAEVKSGPVVG